MTCREYAKKHYPDLINQNANGGVVGCPDSIGLDADCQDNSCLPCHECWDRQALIGGIPVGAPDPAPDQAQTWTLLRDDLLTAAGKIAKSTEFLDADEISMVERLTKLAMDIEDNRIFHFKRAEVIE